MQTRNLYQCAYSLKSFPIPSNHTENLLKVYIFRFISLVTYSQWNWTETEMQTRRILGDKISREAHYHLPQEKGRIMDGHY